MFADLIALARGKFYYLFLMSVIVMFILVLTLLYTRKRLTDFIIPVAFFVTYIVLFVILFTLRSGIRGKVLMYTGIYVMLTGAYTFVMALITVIERIKLSLLLEAASSVDSAILVYLDEKGRVSLYTREFLNTFNIISPRNFERSVENVSFNRRQLTFKSFLEVLAYEDEDKCNLVFDLESMKNVKMDLEKQKVFHEGKLVGYALTKQEEVAKAEPAKVEPVKAKPVMEEPVKVEPVKAEPDVPEGFIKKTRTIYNYSFTSRLHLNDAETDQRYNELKNHLLSYEGVTSNMAWKQETYTYKGKMVAKLRLQGKTLRVFLALDPETLADKYNVTDNSKVKSHETTPSLQVVRGPQQLNHAKELIDLYMNENEGVKDANYKEQDYTLKKIKKDKLVEMKLIKCQNADFLEKVKK